jgi:hypothetical protein
MTRISQFRPGSPDRQINKLPLERIKTDDPIKSFWRCLTLGPAFEEFSYFGLSRQRNDLP